eukprot:Plantae.Rhodophyta-Palmaria_palmata.ctg12327.p1 GENE.Plantae.Rhodophyta-Palmaria_palmata.ctg12327~~Plantae.Rhodophyta-Palmaria_palmata.ctg12327.p1  ORF type:complete len:191 (+),score=28.94 Plantae.Rhodophyta-Palmaria_palmata.ctg12327:72-575(+)
MSVLYEIYCKPVALRAMRGEYPGRGAKEFDMKAFQAWVILASEHGTVGRGDDVVMLDCEELDFTGRSLDSTVYGILAASKTVSGKPQFFRFSRGVHVSVCSLYAIQMWVAVLLSHGITTGALFPKFEGGCFVKGTRVSKENVSETLAYMGEYADLPGKLQLHSGRRA